MSKFRLVAKANIAWYLASFSLKLGVSVEFIGRKTSNYLQFFINLYTKTAEDVFQRLIRKTCRIKPSETAKYHRLHT